MTGVSLSRWTMCYFAAALLALLVAEALMAAGYGYPFAPVESPRTLVVVHLGAVGWLSLLMCGALFQFLPVLVNGPLFGAGLALPALLCLLAGLASLVLGFLSLDGEIGQALPFLPLAGLLLGLGFALVIWILAGTLLGRRPLPLAARFVAAALAGLAVTAAFGVTFTQVLGGVVSGEGFAELTASGVPVHAIAGLGGWLTMCAMGVSYRLFPMFLLAPEPDSRGTRIAFGLAVCAVTAAVAGGLLAILAGWPLRGALVAAALPGSAALSLYARDVLHFYRTRKRLAMELNTRMSALAFISLGPAVVASAVLAAFGPIERLGAAIVYLVAYGWLSGLGLAMLYKIVPFMTWLECYGPLLGRTATPRVQDLVAESRARKWFLLYFAAVWSGAAALIAGNGQMFQVAAGGTLIASAGIAVQLWRARRLIDVDAGSRLPEGLRRPSIFHSLVLNQHHTGAKT